MNILYLEHSPLLRKSAEAEFSAAGHLCHCFVTAAEFLSACTDIGEAGETEDAENGRAAGAGDVIVIGDTADVDIPALVFRLVADSRLPVYLLGEHVLADVLPLAGVLERGQTATGLALPVDAEALSAEERGVHREIWGDIPVGENSALEWRLIHLQARREMAERVHSAGDITDRLEGSLRWLADICGFDRIRADITIGEQRLTAGADDAQLPPGEQAFVDQEYYSGEDFYGKIRGWKSEKIIQSAAITNPSAASQLARYALELFELPLRLEHNKKEASYVHRAFSQFLPAAVIEDLLGKSSEKALMTGETRSIVVLFSHIKHFDEVLERNSPERIARFLNDHFTAMSGVITRFGGTVDKFIGDAVFAEFGVPVSYEDNALRAVEAAGEMILLTSKIDLEGLELPESGYHIGIGINEGPAIVGNIGCQDKFDYTAIGDTVNLAARLESLTSHYGQNLLISQTAWSSVRSKYFCRLVDLARVKGKKTATAIYSVPADPSMYRDDWLDWYRRGFTMYRLGNWHTAGEYLERCLQEMPEDQVCRILLDRCARFQVEEPEHWDGAVTLGFK